MPELPEVETIKRSLEPNLVNKKIMKVQVKMAKLIKKPQDPEIFKDILEGSRFKKVKRRGKYLLFYLDRPWVLVIHLRMTGRLLLLNTSEPIEKHTHLIFNLDDGLDLRFHDVRQFGLIYLVPENKLDLISGIRTMGPEPLSEEYTFNCFRDSIKGKKQRAKAFLLDQSCVAGIGNIYADEILFQAGIHPEETVNNLPSEKLQDLWQAIKDRLKAGVESRGTSIKDYVDGFGTKGSFQEQLKVYGRAGETCIQCENKLMKAKVVGRSTVFCPHCQPKKN
jgi:formamidopyrimidine-DNA glycosylase